MHPESNDTQEKFVCSKQPIETLQKEVKAPGGSKGPS